MRTIDRNPLLYEKRPDTPLSTRLILYAIAGIAVALIILGLTRVLAPDAWQFYLGRLDPTGKR